MTVLGRTFELVVGIIIVIAIGTQVIPDFFEISWESGLVMLIGTVVIVAVLIFALKGIWDDSGEKRRPKRRVIIEDEW